MTLNNYKNKYKDLVKVVSEHEKKIEKFVEIINTVNFIILLFRTQRYEWSWRNMELNLISV